MRPHLRAFAALIALTLTTSACGGNDGNNSAAEPDKIDVAKLDSGNYPVTPSDVEKTRTSDTGAILEAIRIGSAMPLLMEIDGRFIHERSRSFGQAIITPNDPPDVYAATRIGLDEFNSVAPGVVAGWHTRGQRREEYGLGSSAGLYVIRFATPEQANSAFQALADRTSGESFGIPGYPQARTKVVERFEYHPAAMNSWIALGDIVVHLRIEDPISSPFEPARAADLVKRAFDKQIEMLKSYSPTPVDKIGSLPIDVDGLLSRTMPPTKEELPAKGSDPTGVYPKRAALHPESHPDLARAAYDDAGLDYLTVSGRTFVYRTRDHDSTTRLIAALRPLVAVDENYVKVDSPPNMPIAQCFGAKPGSSSAWEHPPVCWFAVDRHVAQVYGRNVQDLHQRTAAQYKLLVSA